MHGSLAGISAYVAGLRGAPAGVTLVICPPFVLLERFAAARAGGEVALGGQDCHAAPQGAHTGDISAPMLKEAGAAYVILGHSERREHHGETNADVCAKVQAAVAAGLIPIVCVGESAMERDAGEAEDVVRTQLRHSLPEGFAGVVAYEPVWAIGTGRIPAAADIIAMHGAIRAALLAAFGPAAAAINILYGGSVKPGNAAQILALPEVGGALVGGASLNPEELLAIAAGAQAL